MPSGRPLLALAVCVLSLGARPAVASAQGTASIQAVAQVSTTGLSAARMNDLAFGSVLPGVPTLVDPRSSASSGLWEVHGTRNAEIAASFALPDSLRVGPHAMPITFGGQAGCGRDRNQQNQCVYFDPSLGWVDRIRNNPNPKNTYYIWIGGTVSPATAQFPGIYTGTITLTVAYTGN